MSARFELVRTDAGYHARLRAGNGQIVWTTEVYTRRRPARNAIGVLARVFNSPTEVDVDVVDERTPPRPPVTLEPPFYRSDGRSGPFWHDHEYHWRFCYGDACTEDTPSVGTHVASRFGPVEVSR